MSDRKRELEDLVAHPGWAWFVERVKAEWGPSGDRFMPEIHKALNLTDNNAAASQARQILSAQGVILALLRAPHEEIAKLGNLDVAKNAQHGARALPNPELYAMSRRGGL